MTDIDTLLAAQDMHHLQKVSRDLGGVFIDSYADFEPSYQAWVRKRPKAYRKAKLTCDAKRLPYPCRVVFTATIISTASAVKIMTHAHAVPI